MMRMFLVTLAASMALVAISCSDDKHMAVIGGDYDGDLPFVDNDGDSVAVDGDDASDGDAPFDWCGVGDDVKQPRAVTRPIYYGTETPALFNMTAGQQKAVGALSANFGWGAGNFCTGTVIAPRVVLTAAHCFDEISSPQSVEFVVGPDAADPQATFEVEAFHVNALYNPYTLTPAEHDNAIVILKQSVLDIASDIEPIPVNTTPLDLSLVGQRVQNGGFGSTHTNDYNSKRWWVDESVRTVSTGEFTVDGQGQGGVCFGDSGGPSLYDFGEGLRVLGTVSWGDESCVDVDHFANAYNDLQWIQSFLNDQPCGDTTEAGTCVSGKRLWCRNDVLAEQDCRAELKLCDTDGSGNAVCVPDPCEGLTFEGECEDANVAAWCEDGEIKRRHCLPCDQVCGYAGPSLGYYCVEPDQAPSDCGNVDFLGCCANGQAYWCDDVADVLHHQDCGDDTCGWVDGSTGYFCGGEGADPSGALPLTCP